MKEDQQKQTIKADATVRLPTNKGEFLLKLYKDPEDGKEHLALIKGDIENARSPLVRVHSECLTGDVFGSSRCDCGDQLDHALSMISDVEAGVLIYLRQEGRGIGLLEKLKAYTLQDEGYDTVQANIMLGHGADERDYSIAGDILKDLKISSIRLITNNPDKLQGLEKHGIDIEHRVPSPLAINTENRTYLKTKAAKLRHILDGSALV